MRKRVVVTEQIHKAGIDLLGNEVDVVRPADLSPRSILDACRGASAIIVRLAKITDAVLASEPDVVVVGKHGVGVDNIDLAAATSRGVIVVNTPVATEGSVAEHVVAMMLTLSRQMRESERGLRDGLFYPTRDSSWIEDLAGKTLAIVGVGRIGARLAEICGRGFRMRILAFDPYCADDRLAVIGAERRATLEEALREADFVSVHTPLTDETRGMIGTAGLAAMKRTAFVINCARGGIVDETALAEAIEAGTIAGAGVDTFASEPPNLEHPLFKLPNVLVTPHVAGGSQDAARLTATTVAKEVLTVLRGETPRFVVNKAVVPKASGR